MIPISASVPDEVFDALNELSIKRKESVSALVREAVTRFLEEEMGGARKKRGGSDT